MKKLISIAFLLLLIPIFSQAEAKPKPCKKCYCSVTATNVNFGSYDTLSQLAVDSAGDVEVSCGTDTIGDVMSYEIKLSGAKKGSKPRKMKGPDSYRLEYNIYTDVARTIIWGDGKGSTALITDSYTFPVLCCVTRNYTSYGRIDAGQNVGPGFYIDSIVVKVNF